MTEQRKLKQRYGLLHNTASVLPNTNFPAPAQFGHHPSMPNIHYPGVMDYRVTQSSILDICLIDIDCLALTLMSRFLFVGSAESDESG